MDSDSLQSVPLKLCRTCNQWKPETREFFVPGKKSHNGLRNLCKVCRQAARRKTVPVPDGYKRCPGCKELLPATLEFWNARKRAKNGLNDLCKQCRKKAYQEKLQSISLDKPAMIACRSCKEELPFTEEFFYKNGRNKYGLFTICKNCHGECGSQYRKANREASNARARRWRARNREHRIAVERKWRVANRERCRERERIRRRTNPEQYKARQLRYRRSPHGRMKNRAHTRTRKSRIKGAGGKITAQDIQKQFKSQKGKCYYCKRRLAKFHIDHVTPVSRGGTNDPCNIVLACPPCNQKKQDKLLHEWPEGGRLI